MRTSKIVRTISFVPPQCHPLLEIDELFGISTILNCTCAKITLSLTCAEAFRRVRPYCYVQGLVRAARASYDLRASLLL
ncbi:hypothetical protein M758_4G024500 [Ceratodon purpureus]|uniref:Uncharacterized protein n=1 Tax=Ceratodon purpureus TaxID=3225 RepID=A0A8T0I7N4_CERPU|nr:hypothetical protein KC19_4G027400 [Ceratodon purpureus]KAG0617916.1 hypothetical protein M758_4G024500 [Ceratodon purpureus]